jgi:hypothetical protein
MKIKKSGNKVFWAQRIKSQDIWITFKYNSPLIWKITDLIKDTHFKIVYRYANTN